MLPNPRPSVDKAKLKTLVDSLEGQPIPFLIPARQFFDGNNDEGSIGCNLSDHPGVDKFRRETEAMLARPDVAAIYASADGYDIGDYEYWVFSCTLYVVGTLYQDAVGVFAAELQATNSWEVEKGAKSSQDIMNEMFGPPVNGVQTCNEYDVLFSRHPGQKLYAVCWD